MTTPKIVFLSTVIGFGAVGVGLEIRFAAHERQQIATLREQTTRLERQTARTRAELTSALQSAAQLEQPRASSSRSVSGSIAPSEPPADGAVEAWLTRVRQLKQLLVENPEHSIPELKLLDENDWLDFSRQAPLYRWPELTKDAIDETFAQLRQLAGGKFANSAFRALKKFAAEHDGLLPATTLELAPDLDPAMLGRYEMRQTGLLADRSSTTIIMAQKSVFDEMRESRLEITAKGAVKWIPSAKILNQDIELATKAFSDANQGRLPGGPAELMPFLEKITPQVDLPVLQKFWDSPLRKKIP